MTGHSAYTQALQLLNYTDTDGNVSPQLNTDLNKRALTVVNQILADVLHCSGGVVTQMETLADHMPIPPEAAPVMVYGIAMLLAQSESDGDNQQLYATLYNSTRSRIPNRNKRVRDTIPYPY